MDVKVRWRECPAAIEEIKRASNAAAVSTHDNVAYVLPYNNCDTTVHKFDIVTSLWSKMKSFPYRKCSLAIIKDLPVLIIGGLIRTEWLFKQPFQLHG